MLRFLNKTLLNVVREWGTDFLVELATALLAEIATKVVICAGFCMVVAVALYCLRRLLCRRPAPPDDKAPNARRAGVSVVVAVVVVVTFRL